LTLEGPTRIMCGVPALWLGHSPGDRHIWRESDGLVLLLVGAASGRHGGDRRRPVTGGAERGSRRACRAAARKGASEAAAQHRRFPG
jgi:hypothetical protein